MANRTPFQIIYIESKRFLYATVPSNRFGLVVYSTVGSRPVCLKHRNHTSMPKHRPSDHYTQHAGLKETMTAHDRRTTISTVLWKRPASLSANARRGWNDASIPHVDSTTRRFIRRHGRFERF